MRTIRIEVWTALCRTCAAVAGTLAVPLAFATSLSAAHGVGGDVTAEPAATVVIDLDPASRKARGGESSDHLAPLARAQPGTTVRWKMESSVTYDLVTDRVLRSGDAWTWVGRDAAGGMSRSYITQSSSYVVGTLAVGGTEWAVEGDAATGIIARNLADERRTRAIWLTPDYLMVPPLTEISLGSRGHDEPKAGEGAASPTSSTTIDVAVLYTPGFVTQQGSVAAAHARIDHLNGVANAILANTAVPITLNIVHRQQVTYSDTISVDAALEDFSGWRASPFGELSPLPALATTVRPIRNAVGADLMVLMRPYHHASHAGCGIGWVGSDANPVSFAQNFGYAVVSVGSDIGGSGFFCPDSAYMHELGHTMGLVHDRPISPFPGARPYAYGYGLSYTGPTPQLGDVMSYAIHEAPFFSSPSVRCSLATNSCALGGSGSPLGVPGDIPPATTCTVNPTTCADGARTLAEMRTFIASFRPTANPVISGTITQPGGAPLAGVAFCAVPAAGVSCTASNSAGFYTCTVPSGWTGTLHSPQVAGMRIPPQRFAIAVSGDTTRNVSTVANAGFGCNLDIDDNGLVEANRDGIAILRRMLGLPGEALTDLPGACANRTSASALAAAANPSVFAVTGASSVTATSDGIILQRAMRGGSEHVTSGVGIAPSATRTTWSGTGQINDWLTNVCGFVYQPVP